MGTIGIGAGAPGGIGLRLEYCRPILVYGVAADFPQLTIIGAHPGWPWTDELLAVRDEAGGWALCKTYRSVTESNWTKASSSRRFGA